MISAALRIALGMHNISVRCIGIIQFEFFFVCFNCCPAVRGRDSLFFHLHLTVDQQSIIEHNSSCPLFHWPCFRNYVEVSIGILSLFTNKFKSKSLSFTVSLSVAMFVSCLSYHSTGFFLSHNQ